MQTLPFLQLYPCSLAGEGVISRVYTYARGNSEGNHLHQFSDWCIFYFTAEHTSPCESSARSAGLEPAPARRSARNTPPERKEPRSGPIQRRASRPAGARGERRRTGTRQRAEPSGAAPTERQRQPKQRARAARAERAWTRRGASAPEDGRSPPAEAQKGRRGNPADREPATAGGAGGAAEASPPERQAPQRGDAAANLVTDGRHPASEPEQPAGGAGRERPKAPPIGGAWSVEGDFVTTATPWLFMRYRA